MLNRDRWFLEIDGYEDRSAWKYDILCKSLIRKRSTVENVLLCIDADSDF